MPSVRRTHECAPEIRVRTLQRMGAFALAVRAEYELGVYRLFGGLPWCGVQMLDGDLPDLR
jgi:hypothetical protein